MQQSCRGGVENILKKKTSMIEEISSESTFQDMNSQIRQVLSEVGEAETGEIGRQMRLGSTCPSSNVQVLAAKLRVCLCYKAILPHPVQMKAIQ